MYDDNLRRKHAMFQIISDGGCDFTKDEVQKYNVGVVPFYITFDQASNSQVTHLKEGVDISKEDYFKRLLAEKNLFPKTAQPNPQDYIDICTPYLEEGKDILLLTISSKLSGSHNSAMIAADMLKEDYPNRTVMVVDSLNVSIGQGLILKEMIKMRDAGYSLEETVRIANEILKTTRIYFTLDSLEYLKKGGRVGPTTALVGGILGLRPVLHLVDGGVEQLDSVRGKKKVLQLIEEGITAALKDETQNIDLCVGHILREDEASTLKDTLENSLGTKITNPVTEVGVTIGTHAGPGALVVAYCKKYEALVK
jgi:DegV family protein with EDD domain